MTTIQGETNTQTISLLSDLRNVVPYPGALVLLIGKNALMDGLGGFYRWDDTSGSDEDAVFMNVLVSNVSVTGRWIRIFQRALVIPQGRLVNNGGVKTAYIPGTTNSSGQVTFNLTTDGTATGPAIFSEIWENVSYATTGVTGATNAVTSYIVSISSDFKTTTHGYSKSQSNALNLSIVTAGLTVYPVQSVGAGIAVQGIFTGI